MSISKMQTVKNKPSHNHKLIAVLTIASVLAIGIAYSVFNAADSKAAKKKPSKSLGRNTVGSKQIKNNSVTTTDIKNKSIIAVDIKESSIDGNLIKDGSITASDLASGVLDGSGGQTDATGSTNNTTTGSGSSGTTQITDGSISSSHIAAGAVGSNQISDGSISSVDIASGAIGTSQLASDSVTQDKIADGAVGSLQIEDGSVTTADIADASVTTAKIAAGAVTTEKLGVKPTAIANRSSAQSISTGGLALTPVELTSERADTSEMHSTSTNSDRFVAPIDGYYLATATVRWEQHATNARVAVLERRDSDDSNPVQIAVESMLGVSTGLIASDMSIAGVVSMSAGQYVELHVYQNSGVALDINSAEAALTWLGPQMDAG